MKPPGKLCDWANWSRSSSIIKIPDDRTNDGGYSHTHTHNEQFEQIDRCGWAHALRCSKFTWLCSPRKLAAVLLDGEEPSMPEVSRFENWCRIQTESYWQYSAWVWGTEPCHICHWRLSYRSLSGYAQNHSPHHVATCSACSQSRRPGENIKPCFTMFQISSLKAMCSKMLQMFLSFSMCVSDFVHIVMSATLEADFWYSWEPALWLLGFESHAVMPHWHLFDFLILLVHCRGWVRKQAHTDFRNVLRCLELSCAWKHAISIHLCYVYSDGERSWSEEPDVNDTSQEVLLLNFMTLIKKKLGRFAVHNISQLGLWEVGLPRAEWYSWMLLFQMQKAPCCAKSLEADAVQEHIRGGFHPSKHVEAWNGGQLRTEHCCDCGAC